MSATNRSTATKPGKPGRKSAKELAEQAIEECRCNRCNKVFSDPKALKHHHSIRELSCIGMWYVCKRCLQHFDTPSTIRAHQSRKKVCSPNGAAVDNADDNGTSHSVKALLLHKGAQDAGSTIEYFRHAVIRSDKAELMSILDICSLADIDSVFEVLKELKRNDRDGLVITALGVLAEFANKPRTSPEKAAKIRAFVIENTIL
jgi:hypothetical protein